MARRGQRKARPPLGDPSDPHGLGTLLEAFLEHSRVRGFAVGTVVNRRRYVRAFVLWCEERGITRAMEVTRPVLERYQRHLFHYRRDNGEPLSFRTQYCHLSPLKMFFKWLARENHILHNPASELEEPRLEQRLPKAVLSSEEAERVLSQPDLKTPVGVRDRAILETLYSTGMRKDGDHPPAAVGPRHRARHADGAPGQGQEGPGAAHRTPRGAVDRQVPRRGAARACDRPPTSARCSSRPSGSRSLQTT